MKAVRSASVGKAIAIVLATAGMVAGTAARAQQAKQPDQPMKAAIFLQNRADRGLDDRLGLLNDLLAGRLANEGFAVIDPDAVATAYQESQRPRGAENATAPAPLEATPLRLAQALGADYLLLATLSSYAKEKRVFKGVGTAYGTDNESVLHTLRVNLRLLDGEQGASLYADTVTASERVATTAMLELADQDVVNRLLATAAMRIADSLARNTARLRQVEVAKQPLARFTVNCNVEGTTLELDSLGLGTAPGIFVAKPGLHQMRLTRQWFEPWERTVNIFDGQTLDITLEMTPAGLAKYKDINAFRQEMELARLEREAGVDIARQQSEADAYVKKTVADGEKVMRSNSHIRFEGDIDSLTIGAGGGGDNKVNLINIVPTN